MVITRTRRAAAATMIARNNERRDIKVRENNRLLVRRAFLAQDSPRSSFCRCRERKKIIKIKTAEKKHEIPRTFKGCVDDFFTYSLVD